MNDDDAGAVADMTSSEGGAGASGSGTQVGRGKRKESSDVCDKGDKEKAKLPKGHSTFLCSKHIKIYLEIFFSCLL